MRTPPMYFSILRAPRCNVYSLVNTWWEGIDSFSGKYKQGYNFRLLGSSVCVQGAGGNSRRWSRRSIYISGDGRGSHTLSSAANINHRIADEIVQAKLTVKRTESSVLSEPLEVEYTDIRQQVAENKELVKRATFIVFDLETTGLSKTSERIIEIALQDLLGGENSTFHTLINPECGVPNAHIHGITTSMVRRPGVPRMHELIPILLKYVRSRQKPGGYVVFIAHNARSFDVPFLVNEFKRCSTEIPSNWLFLDTLPLAREVLKSRVMKPGEKKSLSLQALRAHYGIQLVGSAHRAMSDVHSLSLVLQRITFDLKLPIDGLVQRTFTASELKKKKDSS